MGVGWIRVGVVGSETRGDRKTRQKEAQVVAQDMFGTLWPGKFPKKICADRHSTDRCSSSSSSRKIAAAAEISSTVVVAATVTTEISSNNSSSNSTERNSSIRKIVAVVVASVVMH